MNREAQALARLGRGGDTEIAQVALGELVVPRTLQNSDVISAIGRAAAAHGLSLSRLKVGGANGINPHTGAPEFAFTEDLGLVPNELIGDPVMRGGTPPSITLPTRWDDTSRVEYFSAQNAGLNPAKPSLLQGIETRAMDGDVAASIQSPDQSKPRYDIPTQLDKNEGLPGFRHVYAGQTSGISTINDRADKPSPDRAINSNLAGLAEGFSENGLSLNMNSSTGGKHAKGSAHYSGDAVDFNIIGGRPVSSADAAPFIESFKSYLKQQPQTYKIIGPEFAIQSDGRDGWQSFALSEKDRRTHLNHVHVETLPHR